MFAPIVDDQSAQRSGTAARQRAEGRVALTVARMGERSGLVRLAEAGSARIRLPRVGGAVPEAVVINTAGGIAAGDRFETQITLEPGARLVATSAAAEKIYKSDGETSRIATWLVVRDGAELHWLPQETIPFDRARLRRNLDVEIGAGATLIAFEAVAFGRAASSERISEGFFEDRWRVRREGRLVFADTLRLSVAIGDALDRPTVAGGHRALATLLYAAPDATTRIDAAREWLDGGACESGASAWNGLLVVRWLAPSIGALRRDAARFMTALRGAPMPRVWQA